MLADPGVDEEDEELLTTNVRFGKLRASFGERNEESSFHILMSRVSLILAQSQVSIGILQEFFKSSSSILQPYPYALYVVPCNILLHDRHY